MVEKTLDSTTQMQVEPVELDYREIPKQHLRKQLLMLHHQQLRGCTDADTFSSTLKPIQAYLCVQISFRVISDYLFVICMQRESHSNGDYQDYIRKVGASEVIITDNYCTQIGNKWDNTSRKVIKKQRKYTPHNQNKNKVERHI